MSAEPVPVTWRGVAIAESNPSALGVPSRPSESTPPRLPGSVRRTTVFDCRWIEPERLASITGSGRDAATDADGRLVTVAASSLAATVRAAPSVIESVSIEPHIEGIETLVGTPIAGGFGRVTASFATDPGWELTRLLLDELPRLGYLGVGAIRNAAEVPIDRTIPPPGTCRAWDADGWLATRHAARQLTYVKRPPAPVLADPTDPEGWHTAEPQRAEQFRRVRRLDVLPTPHGIDVDSMFRDTVTTPDGTVWVVHEYTLRGTIGRDATISSLTAEPRVLPGPECPAAANTAGEMVGVGLGEVRQVLRRLGRHTTCTHLNDALLALVDIDRLAAQSTPN